MTVMKKMTGRKGAIIGALMTLSGSAMAAPYCGAPPGVEPAIPDGTKVSKDGMLAGVNAVKAYSERVDGYLACKDQRAIEVFQWMNEEQRARWEEDLNAVHERRVELQRQMNESIRVFNSHNTESSSD